MCLSLVLNRTESKVLENIELTKQELVKLLENLVEVRSTNPPGNNYEKIGDVILDWARSRGIHSKIVQPPSSQTRTGKKPIVLCELEGKSKEFAIHLNGHYDVVPVSRSWSDGFKLVRVGEKLYGRGTADMKGGIASMLFALSNLHSMDLNLEKGISFSAVPDEESDGEFGSKFLVDQKYVNSSFCIVGEPTGVGSIVYAQKGSLWATLTIMGKESDGPRPWLGVNAFVGLSRLATMIEDTLAPEIAEEASLWFRTVRSSRCSSNYYGRGKSHRW